MNEIEKELLEHLFDALDRLFDNEISIIDLHDLFLTSDKSITILDLKFYIDKLKFIIKNRETEEVKKEQALEITNNLRFKLSELLD